MIIQNVQHFIANIFSLCILLFLCCLTLVSCVKEESLYTNPEVSNEEATFKLTISTPSITIPQVTTRSQTEAEAKIQELIVLVFRDDKFQYMAEGLITSSTVASTTLNVVLKSSSNPLTLFLVANSNDVINNSGISVNDSKTVAKEKINRAFLSTGLYPPFPMFGEHEVASLNPNGNNNISGIKMLRSIARADVLVADEVTNFELVSVQLFRASSKIQVIPDLMVNAAVTSPSIPDDAEANVATLPFTVTGNKSELQLYFPESEAPIESNRISDATCIVIGGKYNGSPNTTYYRMDFNTGIQGHPFGQILRNHKYTFNIKRVGFEGESTPEEAANSQSTGVIVDVESWDENSVDMWYEGENYFSVSARTLFLRPWAGTFKQSAQLEVRTNISGYTIQWSDANGTPIEGSSPSATSISKDHCLVRIVNNVIQVIVLNNEQDADRLDYFVIHAGKWDIVITINQYGLSKHMNDLIRVLSFTEIGDLGTGYANETTATAAIATRQILNKQFCPNGVFKFGGYHFSKLAQVTTGTTLSPTVLSNYDVILFPYNQQQNQTTSNNVMAWLNAKPNRVLIMGADATNTNVNLLATAGDNLGWNYTNSGVTNFNFVVNESNDIFTMYGLFGIVSTNSKYKSYDGIWGRVTNANSQVVPLLETSNGEITLGVNMDKRIVYIGETQMLYNYSGGLSNATGAINTDHDRLMANLWAWITEVVLSGK